jgi:putative transposase
LEQRKEAVIEVETFCEYYLERTCDFAGVSRSCIYYQRKHILVERPGRPCPGFTINRDGRVIYDSEIVSILKEYRDSPFFLNAGGSRKLSKYISIEKAIYINHKKIYRLCEENNLLLFKQSEIKKRKIKKSRCEYFEVNGPNQLWQFDLKYIWIHGESRWCFLLAFIDVYSKKVTGYYLGKSCKAGDLIFTLDQALRSEGIAKDHSLIIRSDNGPQMSSNRFHFYLKRLEQKLTHEFIPPRTPNRNAFIEAFNSILEIEVLQVRYFRNFREVYETIVEFIEFYNTRRLHGSIKNLSPKMFIDKLKTREIMPQVVAV